MKKEEKNSFLLNEIVGKRYDKAKGILRSKDYSDKYNTDNIVVVSLMDSDYPKCKFEKIIISDLDFINGKNEDAIRIAICRAYLDLQLRTIKNHENISNEIYTWKEENPLGYLFSRVKAFFEIKEMNEQDFDVWHKETCDNFIDRYNKLLEPKGVEKQTIGKAQKIVNMTLKYLYCMANDACNKLFKFCHMALDHYTLENWFCRVLKPPVNIEKWSNISEYGELQEPKEGSYFWIQSKIRKCFEKSKFTSFQAEFIIWQDEKIRESLLNVVNLSIDDFKRENQNNKDLKAIIEEAGKKIQELNKIYL